MPRLLQRLLPVLAWPLTSCCVGVGGPERTPPLTDPSHPRQTVIKQNGLETTWESNLSDYWDEDVDNTVPIVVGVVLGVLVLIVVIAYFVSRVRRNKEE